MSGDDLGTALYSLLIDTLYNTLKTEDSVDAALDRITNEQMQPSNYRRAEWVASIAFNMREIKPV